MVYVSPNPKETVYACTIRSTKDVVLNTIGWDYINFRAEGIAQAKSMSSLVHLLYSMSTAILSLIVKRHIKISMNALIVGYWVF